MKNGLKGVTDATVFCKSMKKGGPAAMIQPMSKYMAGGTTGLSTGVESSDSNKPPRWWSDIVTDVKRGVRKIKNNIQINFKNKLNKYLPKW